MAFTTLLSTNRGSTQRALKIDVRKNSSHDQTSPCSDGSPKKRKIVISLTRQMENQKTKYGTPTYYSFFLIHLSVSCQ
jgi:hypothetical protein